MNFTLIWRRFDLNSKTFLKDTWKCRSYKIHFQRDTNNIKNYGNPIVCTKKNVCIFNFKTNGRNTSRGCAGNFNIIFLYNFLFIHSQTLCLNCFNTVNFRRIWADSSLYFWRCIWIGFRQSQNWSCFRCDLIVCWRQELCGATVTPRELRLVVGILLRFASCPACCSAPRSEIWHGTMSLKLCSYLASPKQGFKEGNYWYSKKICAVSPRQTKLISSKKLLETSQKYFTSCIIPNPCKSKINCIWYDKLMIIYFKYNILISITECWAEWICGVCWWSSIENYWTFSRF